MDDIIELSQKIRNSPDVVRMFELMDKMNAGIFKITARKGDSTPLCSLVFMDGPSAAEILPAIDAIEQAWD